jgi:glycosyltransferase involved in cell wall biosynthesis
VNPPRKAPQRVLHLVGAAEDNGGILSTIRGLSSGDEPREWDHMLWVNAAFLQTRRPQLTCRYSPHALDESRSHFRLLLAAWRSWPDLKRLLDSEPASVIHAHSRGALPLACQLARRRYPILFTNHAYARRTTLYRLAARTPGLITVLLTPAMARHYRLSPTPGHVDIIPECGGRPFFELPLPTHRPHPRDGLIRIVGVGNIVAWKKWDLLVQALARIHPSLRSRVQITIWGPIPADRAARQYSEDLRSDILRLDLQNQIRLAGPSVEIDRVLSRADWFVLPSTNEPCSVSLIEALACGVPALVSASGGNVDIVRDGFNGTFFEPDSPRSLQSRLESILDHNCTLDSPAEIRASVAHHSASRVAAQYGEIYRSIAIHAP